METILLIHGPNLNILGMRETKHYGVLPLSKIEEIVAEEARNVGLETKVFQSNHEGALIDWIQEQSLKAAGIIINPGALTHYSFALHDALKDTGLPVVEVHLSKIKAREVWRKRSVTAPACIKVISGKKEKGYVEAVHVLAKRIAQ